MKQIELLISQALTALLATTQGLEARLKRWPVMEMRKIFSNNFKS
ncbi:hypothetical protein NEOC65_000354 [Neochlamydia sp. AcF65]|nr:hypothetical protein [Neochlamydia sp. AcF65]